MLIRLFLMHFMSIMNYRKSKTIFLLSLNSHVYLDTLYSLQYTMHGKIYIFLFYFCNLYKWDCFLIETTYNNTSILFNFLNNDIQQNRFLWCLLYPKQTWVPFYFQLLRYSLYSFGRPSIDILICQKIVFF